MLKFIPGFEYRGNNKKRNVLFIPVLQDDFFCYPRLEAKNEFQQIFNLKYRNVLIYSCKCQ